jgi:hypothetical protein
VESIVESEYDEESKLVKRYIKMLLRNDKHVIGNDIRNVAQYNDYAVSSSFMHKPEVALLEGVLWNEFSESYLNKLIRKLQAIFNGNDYTAQCWRQKFFASMTCFSVTHTYSGDTIMTHTHSLNESLYEQEHGKDKDHCVYDGKPYCKNVIMGVPVYSHESASNNTPSKTVQEYCTNT